MMIKSKPTLSLYIMYIMIYISIYIWKVGRLILWTIQFCKYSYNNISFTKITNAGHQPYSWVPAMYIYIICITSSILYVIFCIDNIWNVVWNNYLCDNMRAIIIGFWPEFDKIEHYFIIDQKISVIMFQRCFYFTNIIVPNFFYYIVINALGNQ